MALVERLKNLQADHQFRQVHRIQLICGPYNCVGQEQLQFWFDELAQGSPWAGARILIKRLAASKFCLQCQREDVLATPASSPSRCPHCSGPLISPQDHGVYISNIEVD